MAVQIVFETHSTSEDNEQGVATDGWAGVFLARVANRHNALASGDVMTVSMWSSRLT